jgi:hypothetical protein
VAAWFAGADSDGDGRLTRAEFVADGARYFGVLDSSGDGTLQATEIDSYEAGVLAPLARGPGPRGGHRPGGIPPGGMPSGGVPPGAVPPGGPPSAPKMRAMPDLPRGAGLFGLINSPHPVKAADRDMDSRVTKAEWQRTLSDRFAMLDKDRAGALALETLPKTPVQQIAPRRKP